MKLLAAVGGFTLFFLSSATSALAAGGPTTESVLASDRDGVKIRRTILTEPRPDDRTLLLVIEEPQFGPEERPENALPQRAVFRRSYRAEERRELEAAIRKFRNASESFSPPVKTDPLYAHLEAKPLWVPVRDAWTDADEKGFSQWIGAIQPELLAGSGILVDCADTGLALRWIYARMNRLPVANSLSSSGALIGHFSRSEEWDRLPTSDDWRRDQRFKAALTYLFENTYTHSINKDLYPVQISRDYVVPGTIHLMLSGSTGHTQTIKVAGRDPYFCPQSNCITALWGNEPARETIYYTPIIKGNPLRGQGGYMRWRAPVNTPQGWRLVAASSMPGYSLEQYAFPDLDPSWLQNWVEEKLGFPVSVSTRLKVRAETFWHIVMQRKKLLLEAIAFCGARPCVPGSADYDAYSTPTRDRRLRELAAEFWDLAPQLPATDPYLKNLQKEWQRTALAGEGLLSLWDLFTNRGGVLAALSPDPRRPWLERWGISPSGLTTTQLFVGEMTAIQGLFELRHFLAFEGWTRCVSLPRDRGYCDPASAAIRALWTREFDAALRKARDWWRDWVPLNRASIDTGAFDDESDRLRSAYMIEADCGGWRPGFCTAFDFLDPSKPMLDAMSPNPEDPWRTRWGL